MGNFICNPNVLVYSAKLHQVSTQGAPRAMEITYYYHIDTTFDNKANMPRIKLCLLLCIFYSQFILYMST